MLCRFVCCQNDYDSLGITTVPQTKTVELTALLIEIEWIRAVMFNSSVGVPQYSNQ